MITVVSNLHTADLIEPGLLVVGLVWLGYLTIRLTGLCIDRMARQSTMDQHAVAALQLASKPASYVGFDEDEPFPAELAPDLDEDRVTDEDTGRHSQAAVEMTGFMPVTSGQDGAS